MEQETQSRTEETPTREAEKIKMVPMPQWVMLVTVGNNLLCFAVLLLTIWFATRLVTMQTALTDMMNRENAKQDESIREIGQRYDRRIAEIELDTDAVFTLGFQTQVRLAQYGIETLPLPMRARQKAQLGQQKESEAK